MAISENKYWSTSGIVANDFPSASNGIVNYSISGILDYFNLVTDISFDVYDSITALEDFNFGFEVLDVDVYEFEYVVVNEHTDVLDEVVEVGVSPEYFYIVEDLSAYLDELFADVYDDISTQEDLFIITPPVPDLSVFYAEDLTVEEYYEPYLPIETSVYDDSTVEDYNDTVLVVLIDVYESVSIEEDLSLYLDSLNIDYADDITVLEDVYVSRGLDIADYVTVEEDFTFYFDVYNLSVSDDVAVNESVSVVDIIIELGTVSDDVTLEENLSLHLTVLNVSESDTVVVEDSAEMFMPILVLNDILEDVISEEVVTLSLSALFLQANSDILITEVALLTDLVIELGVVEDSVAVAEYTSVFPDVLYLDVFETTITYSEYTELLLAELFISHYEAFSVTEYAETFLPILNITYSEQITITEATSFELVLAFSVIQIVVVQEYINMLDIEIDIDLLYEDVAVSEVANAEVATDLKVDESVTVTENVSTLLPLLYMDVLDPYHVLITESISVVDLVVEVGVVMEAIGVQDVVSVLIPILTVSVYESIAIEEYAEVLDIIIEVEAFDNISFAEFFGREMPINFEVAEQRGICIVTVSGW